MGDFSRFKQLATSNVRNSSELCTLTYSLEKALKISDDRSWEVKEQAVLNSLDAIHPLFTSEQRKGQLAALEKRFPESIRVQRLLALELEANRDYKGATGLYDDMLEYAETKEELKLTTEQAVSRRKVAILKAQGKLKEAIGELSKYLEVYQSDHLAWLELGLLSAEQLDYEGAAFCFEELVIIFPSNAVYFLLLAEALMSGSVFAPTKQKDSTLKKSRIFESARKYVSYSLFLSGKQGSSQGTNSFRGYLNLLYITRESLEFGKLEAASLEMTEKLHQFAKQKLAGLCKQGVVNSKFVPIVERLLSDK